jgi:hypothetical protein
MHLAKNEEEKNTMPRNPNKRNCAVPGCNAWAMRESDPPRCAPHSGKVAAPEGNQNRLVHGLYATAVRPDERDAFEAHAGDATLAAEIAITRIALRRIFGMLLTGETPGDNPRPLDAQDLARYISLAFRGAGTISRLLRANHAVGGGASDIPQAIESALDALGDRWDLEL